MLSNILIIVITFHLINFQFTIQCILPYSFCEATEAREELQPCSFALLPHVSITQDCDASQAYTICGHHIMARYGDTA